MSPAEVGGLVILLLFVLFGLGVEVGFAMAIAGGTGFAIMVNTDAALNMMAKDIFSRWMLATDYRAAETTDPVNYRLIDNKLEPVE